MLIYYLYFLIFFLFTLAGSFFFITVIIRMPIL